MRRRSTSGVVLTVSGCLVRHASTLQSVTSLSSTEAEFYAASKGACMALGLQSYLHDLGVESTITLYTDSSGAKAFAERRGVGRIRHIATRWIWLQERVAAKHILLRKIAGTENVSDVLTKALPEAATLRWLHELGYRRVGES